MKEAIYIGKMDRRIEVVKRIKAKGSTGAEIFTDTNIACIWANRKTEKTTEDLDDKIVTVNAFCYLIRFHPDISNEKIQHLYIKDSGVEYDIYGVEEIGRKQFLSIKCERRE